MSACIDEPAGQRFTWRHERQSIMHDMFSITAAAAAAAVMQTTLCRR